MKTIKSFLVLAMLLISTWIFAQPPGGGQRGGKQGPPPIPCDKQIEKMVNDLSGKLLLSEEQEVKVLGLYKEHFAEVKEKTSGHSRLKREEMEALKLAFEIQVKTVLTEEQKGKYVTYLKRKKPQRR